MTPMTNAGQPAGLTAAPGDPLLGVHVLTEFIYCPRAGVVAFEAKTEDCGEEERPGRLDYLPRYDLQNIETALAATIKRLAFLAGGVLLIIVGTVVLMLAWDQRIVWAGAALTAILLVPACWTAVDVVRLIARRAAALAAEGREPLLGTADVPEPIDWWQLRNCGYTAKKYEESLCDVDWKLAGRPYLVLCRGDVRIPVFRQHRPQEKLYRQHFARIAAYCHLVERCTGFKSPYGVILFGNTYQGVALRNSPAARTAFYEGLKQARQTVRDARRGVEPLPPPSELCLHCPVGRPVIHRPGETDTVSDGGVLPVRGALGPEGKLFHSPCGDRFRWLPPHERVHQLPLWSTDP